MPSKFKLPQNIEMTFETERLIFRPLTTSDKDFYTSLYTDKKIMRLIAKPFSIEQANKAFDATLKSQNKSFDSDSHMKTWTIVDKKCAQLLGIVSLNWCEIKMHTRELPHATVSFHPNEPEIGIILSRTAQGKQLAEEAITGILIHGFHKLKISTFHTFYQYKNIAVERFIRKLGFQKSELLLPTEPNTKYQFITLRTFKPFKFAENAL